MDAAKKRSSTENLRRRFHEKLSGSDRTFAGESQQGSTRGEREFLDPGSRSSRNAELRAESPCPENYCEQQNPMVKESENHLHAQNLALPHSPRKLSHMKRAP